MGERGYGGGRGREGEKEMVYEGEKDRGLREEREVDWEIEKSGERAT